MRTRRAVLGKAFAVFGVSLSVLACLDDDDLISNGAVDATAGNPPSAGAAPDATGASGSGAGGLAVEGGADGAGAGDAEVGRDDTGGAGGLGAGGGPGSPSEMSGGHGGVGGTPPPEGGSGGDDGLAGGGGSAGGVEPEPVINGCVDFVDATHPLHARTISWDFAVGFEPRRCLLITVGQSVTWSGPLGTHPLQPAGGTTPTPILADYGSDATSHTISFPAPGTYGYVCGNHSTMQGAVRVAP